MKGKIYSISLFIWTSIVFAAILMPQKDIIAKPRFLIEIPNIDKIVHVILFGVFTFLLACTLRANHFTKKKLYTISIALPIALGFLTECLQKIFFEYIMRTFDWMDISADIIGCFLALVIFYLLTAFSKANKK